MIAIGEMDLRVIADPHYDWPYGTVVEVLSRTDHLVEVRDMLGKRTVTLPEDVTMSIEDYHQTDVFIGDCQALLILAARFGEDAAFTANVFGGDATSEMVQRWILNQYITHHEGTYALHSIGLTLVYNMFSPAEGKILPVAGFPMVDEDGETFLGWGWAVLNKSEVNPPDIEVFINEDGEYFINADEEYTARTGGIETEKAQRYCVRVNADGIYLPPYDGANYPTLIQTLIAELEYALSVFEDNFSK